MPHLLTEVAVYSVEAAIAAQQAGASRLELCSDMKAGGITPSYGSLIMASKHLQIPLQVIIRPRGGDFLYTDLEFEKMKVDIRLCRELGVNGVVFGILNPDGSIDTGRCEELRKLAGTLSCTFHRAFDMVSDPFKALEDIIRCGFDRILTSGCKTSAIEGAPLLAQLVEKSGQRIVIMPGGGVRKENIAQLFRLTKATEFHTSAPAFTESAMIYRNNEVNMGKGSEQDEFVQYQLDTEELKRFIHTINQIDL